MTISVRPAGAEDAAACAAIYAPYVRDTVVSFEVEPPGADEMVARIAAAHVWLVAEDAGAAVGYAYARRHRERAAYRYACDVTVYVDAGHQRGGVGTLLYTRLLDEAARLGFHAAFAGIAQPNPGSVALHRRLGFHEVGTYEEVGRKFDAWHDVLWMQRRLGSA